MKATGKHMSIINLLDALGWVELVTDLQFLCLDISDEWLSRVPENLHTKPQMLDHLESAGDGERPC